MSLSERKDIKVGATSPVKKTANAIAWAVDESHGGDGTVRARALGAGAVNQAAKAIAVASGLVATKGKTLWCRIGFESAPNGSENSPGELSVVVFNLSTR